MATTLAALHALDVDDIGLTGLRRPESLAERQLRRWTRQWHASKTRELPLIDELAELFAERLPDEREQTLVHGDYHLGNALVAQDGERAGDPRLGALHGRRPAGRRRPDGRLLDGDGSGRHGEDALFPEPVTALPGFPDARRSSRTPTCGPRGATPLPSASGSRSRTGRSRSSSRASTDAGSTTRRTARTRSRLQPAVARLATLASRVRLRPRRTGVNSGQTDPDDRIAGRYEGSSCMARARNGGGQRPPRLKPGVKREQIIEVATEYFGQTGYEDTKWADVAEAVGIGSTALYHYFESKQHCLFEIMVGAVSDFSERFERITAEHDDWTEALVAVLVDSFDLTEQQILRHRVMVAEFGRVGMQRSLPREEAARSRARALTRELEFAWGTFLARGMQQGLAAGERSAADDARDARPLQLCLALVPVRRDPDRDRGRPLHRRPPTRDPRLLARARRTGVPPGCLTPSERGPGPDGAFRCLGRRAGGASRTADVRRRLSYLKSGTGSSHPKISHPILHYGARSANTSY